MLLTSERAVKGLRPYLSTERGKSGKEVEREGGQHAPPHGLDLGPPTPPKRALLLVHPAHSVPHCRLALFATIRVKLESERAHSLDEILVRRDEHARAHFDWRLVQCVVLVGPERARV